MEPSSDFSRLVEIMAALRDPVSGCPWDLEQSFSTIRHYTIEEAYEVADAIERGDFDDLRDELGDLLLQPVYHAQMAAEAGLFTIGDVIQAITEKLVRRHPHVFGEDKAVHADGAKSRWESLKVHEREAKAQKAGRAASILDEVARALPALARADKLAKRAAKVGFDWPDAASVTEKVREELSEVEAAEGKDAVAEEVGDLLFAAANLARKLGVDPEAALSDANLKFERRFRHVEARLAAENMTLAEAGLERMERHWNEVRAADKAGGA
ncbi:MAG: nucleoside triphosphate pyrophosphohydrolase [Cucumibacter sp.]